MAGHTGRSQSFTIPEYFLSAGVRRHHSMTITPAEAQLSATEKLNGFPPAVAESYLAFAESGEASRLDHVVLGVLQFYLAQPPPQPLVELPGTTRLGGGPFDAIVTCFFLDCFPPETLDAVVEVGNVLAMGG